MISVSSGIYHVDCVDLTAKSYVAGMLLSCYAIVIS